MFLVPCPTVFGGVMVRVREDVAVGVPVVVREALLVRVALRVVVLLRVAVREALVVAAADPLEVADGEGVAVRVFVALGAAVRV